MSRKLLTNIRSNTIGFLYYLMAVLVAIAIPIFTTQLEKSRENTDLANLRGAYAAATVAAMNGELPAGGALDDCYYDPGADGSLSSAGVKLGQGTKTDGKTDVDAVKGYSDYKTNTEAKGKPIKVTFKSGMVDKINFGS